MCSSASSGTCPASRALRMRIEHAQILDAGGDSEVRDARRVASMQPTHSTSDMPWAAARLGAERGEEGAYAWRALLDTGAVLPSGSDSPVESVEPAARVCSRRYPAGCMGNPSGG